MKEGWLPKRQYTEEFKAKAVRLAASVGGHEAARRLGVPVATVGSWSRRGIARHYIGRHQRCGSAG